VGDIDDFEAVRQDPDPIRRGRRASALLNRYQQRATELARLRRAAIEEARRAGMSYTEIASALGLSKGRITQIRSSGPAPERAFFGVGPVAVGAVLRAGFDDRPRTYIDAADAAAQEEIETLLTALSISATRFPITADLVEPPAGDAVIICGPKSAPLAAALLARDPVLRMVAIDGRWWIEDRSTGDRHASPRDAGETDSSDVAYVGRHRWGDRVLIHIAGIHSYGSLGAAHYLGAQCARLWSDIGDASFSMVVRCAVDGLRVTDTERVAGPYRW
jgi:hypothetical protein